MSEWKNRFLEISATRFYREKLSSIVMRYVANTDVQVRPEWEVKKNVLDASVVPAQRSMPAPAVTAQSCKPASENDKLMRSNPCVYLNDVDTAGVSTQGSMTAPENDMPMRSNRILHLMDILATFGSMRYPSCSPTALELRLYYHILEHVRASMWLFLARETPEETIQRLDESTGPRIIFFFIVLSVLIWCNPVCKHLWCPPACEVHFLQHVGEILRPQIWELVRFESLIQAVCLVRLD